MLHTWYQDPLPQTPTDQHLIPCEVQPPQTLTDPVLHTCAEASSNTDRPSTSYLCLVVPLWDTNRPDGSYLCQAPPPQTLTDLVPHTYMQPLAPVPSPPTWTLTGQNPPVPGSASSDSRTQCPIPVRKHTSPNDECSGTSYLGTCLLRYQHSWAWPCPF